MGEGKGGWDLSKGRTRERNKNQARHERKPITRVGKVQGIDFGKKRALSSELKEKKTKKFPQKRKGNFVHPLN